MTTPAIALAQLWRWAGCPPFALERVRFTGGDPVLPGVFQVGTAPRWPPSRRPGWPRPSWGELRGGGEQTVSVDARAAAATFRSERYLRVDGEKPPDPWSPVSGYYRTARRALDPAPL